MQDQIDFPRLAAELLSRAETLIPQWLQGGKRNGPEWECADLSGGHGTSCKVNLCTGKWADFATDDCGGDLIALYGAIHGIKNGPAARRLMVELGWAQPDDGDDKRGHRSARPTRPVAPKPAQPEKADDKPARSTWAPIVPVPDGVPTPDLKHFQRGLPQASWRYVVDGQLYGYVARYETSEGGKDIVPWTWCQDKGDSRGLMKWHMKQWDEPRPLYLPSGQKPVPTKITVVVEGEKCAVELHNLLQSKKPGTYQVVSWPGGGKAWDKAAWHWLSECVNAPVILWPDCDAKRVKLTAAERKEGVDQSTKPILPADKQPGLVTMRGIAQSLAQYGCALAICDIPAPGDVPDGWDVYDAINVDGWDFDKVELYLLNAPSVDQPAPPPLQTAGASPSPAKRDTWQSQLLFTDKGAVKACRENVVTALDGVPTRGIPGIPGAAGVIAFNEFTNNVVKLKPTPWGTRAGEWLEEDELEMGEWLVREHYMPSMPRTGLEEAVKMVAGRHRYHPVRQYLDGLRGAHDGVPRMKGWIQRVCQPKAPVDVSEADNNRYLDRVGCWMLMAMVARVMDPGCKFDYMVIFEGPQGAGKSTLARTLGGDWYADTGLVMGEKDAYQNLQGVLVYEIGEMDSFSKAEVTKVKAFVSSQKDRFRASFDRRPRDYPRQVVFVGTTNESHYLTDPTGNRRFWPVCVGGQIDIAWLKENRDQLFAEALAAYEAGHRFHPTADEQKVLFAPQQGARTVETPIESRIVSYLYDEHQKVGVGRRNGAHVNEISTTELLECIGIGIEKQANSPNLVKQANAILRNLGWREGKSSGKGGMQRVNVFKRPATY